MNIEKTVAQDDDCNGTADDPSSWAPSVTQDRDKCVVYRICVENTGTEDLSGITVSRSRCWG